MKKSRAVAAFTLVEVLVAACVSCVLAGIIYTMGSEALFSFCRNLSVNRCYSDARGSLDRIGNALQSAGHVPVLLNEDGSAWASTALASTPAMNATSAAGMRFFCNGTMPTFKMTSCSSGSTTMTITIPAGGLLPKNGDLVSIGAVGFQGIVSGTPTGTTSMTLSFTDQTGTAQSIGNLCSPAITTTTDITATQNYCLLYNRVAFIAVSSPALTSPAAAPTAGNTSAATSTELRYYPDANVLTKYKVIARLVINQTDPQEKFIQRPRPFQIISSPTVTTTLCVQAPDYSNRVNVISDASSFTRVQTSLGSRCPLLLTGSL